MRKLNIIIIFCLLAVISLNMIWFTYIKVCSYLIEPISIKDTVSVEKLLIDNKLSKMTLRQKIASLLILHKSGTDTDTIGDYLKTHQPGGIIFMGDNIPNSVDELSNMTKQLQTDKMFPYLFAIDGEGGVVNRLSTDTYPAARRLKYLPVEKTELAFKERSVLLKRIGININFGIVADVSDNTNSFIYNRVFGGDSKGVGERVAAAVRGSRGIVISTLKHYPGHGETASDSHISVPNTDVDFITWQKQDEPPFIVGINAGADMVMFGHLIYSKVDQAPASLSKKWHQILTESGFSGITITDDMAMLQQSGDNLYSDPVTNSISAINAGNTMILFVTNQGGVSEIDPNSIIDGIESAVIEGKINQVIINNNARKVLRLRYNLGRAKL